MLWFFYSEIVLTCIPHGVKSNVFCLINNEENVRRRNACCDCGVWSTEAGRNTRHPYIRLPAGGYKRVFFRGGVYTNEKVVAPKRTYVIIEPQPNDVLTLCRYCTKQKGNTALKKRVSWLDGATSLNLPNYAIVEYVGEPMLSLAHGNSTTSTESFQWTQHATLQHAGEQAKVNPIKTVYDKMITDMDIVDAPRDSRIVRNKKYNDKTKERGIGKTYQLTFADEAQQICSLVPTDDFVKCATITSDHVTRIILYTSRQISDLSSMCFSRKTGCVLSFDKTYNLSKLYLTVGVYVDL